MASVCPLLPALAVAAFATLAGTGLGAQVEPRAKARAKPAESAVKQKEAPTAAPPAALEELIAEQLQDRVGHQYGTNRSLLAIHGFLRAVYEDFERKPSEFDLRHVFIFFDARLEEVAQIWVELEYEHGSETIELDKTELRVFPAEGLTVAAGRFYNPFGIERRSWYPTVNPLVSRPDVMRRIVPGSWYETGVRLDYRTEIAGLAVEVEGALSNGLGAAADTNVRKARQFRDNNNDKALTGRVAFSPLNSLTLGASAATMKYNRRGDALRFFGLDGEVRTGPVTLRSEAVWSRLERTGALPREFDRKGFYVLGAWEFWRGEEASLALAARYDWIDLNDRVEDTGDYGAYTLGIRWRPRSFTT